jgi:D-psicose/D-tagatose/L-ribulose 3-epimerase
MTTRTAAIGIDNAPIAVNTWVWHCPLTQDLLADRLRQLSEWGFEAVEMPYENVGDWDPRVARELLQQHGLVSLVGCVFAPGRELTNASDDVIESTKDYIRACVDVASVQGAPLVIGPMYSSVGRTWRMDADERRTAVRTARENLAEVADYAGERGIMLGVEPLNRYETSLFNTAEQLMEIIAELPAESIGVNLDTYHMNIEETAWSQAFDVVGDRLVHLQVCGNDRGAPGSDHSDWDEIGKSLTRIEYRGALGIESFTAFNETIATAASIWRPLARSQDALATDGLAFLQKWRDSWLTSDGAGLR